jgi:dTDP-4-dehydrorhamnose reductase
MKVLVTGGSGFLGSYLMKALGKKGFDVIGTSFTKSSGNLTSIDLTDTAATQTILKSVSPDVIINTVALTNVDECHNDMAKAHKLNVQVVSNLAHWVTQNSNSVHFVQVSTDHLYSLNGPHTEEQISPINVYALTKLDGESVAEVCLKALVLRTNFFGSFDGKVTYIDWLEGALKNKEKITVFNDVRFSPLYVSVLCDIIARSIEAGLTGVYNAGAADSVTKADFALKLADMRGYGTENVTVDSIKVKNITDRPFDMSMDSSKLQQVLGIKLPNVYDSLEMYLGA